MYGGRLRIVIVLGHHSWNNVRGPTWFCMSIYGIWYPFDMNYDSYLDFGSHRIIHKNYVVTNLSSAVY